MLSLVSAAELLSSDLHYRSRSQGVSPEARQRTVKRQYRVSLTQIDPGVLSMVGQTATTEWQAGEEESSFPISVAECIRALNLKAVLEEGPPILLWKALLCLQNTWSPR